MEVVVGTAVNKLCLLPIEVASLIPNGFLLIINTPLPRCDAEPDLKVLPTRLA